jgi:prepilin-type N-terminal cleavage/methylation domain-containing protein
MRRGKQRGFTILELLLVVVAIGILGALIFSTYASVQRNRHNQERQRDIQVIYQQLENYYVANDNSKYPTLSDLNNPAWRAVNLKTLSQQALRDPASKRYTLVAKPAKNAYSYEVTTADGSPCDNAATICAHYTLTATLQNSAQKTFVKSSLN